MAEIDATSMTLILLALLAVGAWLVIFSYHRGRSTAMDDIAELKHTIYDSATTIQRQKSRIRKLEKLEKTLKLIDGDS